MGHKLVHWLVMITVLLAWSAQAPSGLAEENNELQNLDLDQLMKVQFYTASKRPQNANDAPASVTVVTGEEIRTYGYRTLAEILDSVRGFWANYDYNYNYIGVRGSVRPGDYNTRILLLLNGHRINDNIYEEATVGTEFPLDLDLIERVEIVRGPSSSLYGTNAVLGTINVITKQPPLSSNVEVSLQGSSGFTRQARVTAGLPQVLDGALMSATMYRSNGEENLYFPEFDSPDTNNGIAHDLDSDGSNTGYLLLNWKHFQFESAIGSRQKKIPTASFGSIFGDPGEKTTDTHFDQDVLYKRDWASGLQLTSRWYYDRYDYRGTYPYWGDDGSRLVGYDAVRGDETGAELDISRPFGPHHTVTAGGEFRYNPIQRQQYHVLGSPTMIMDDHRRSSVSAAFVEDEVKIGSRLLLNAGVRLDHYSTFGNAASPRFAAVYHADSKTQLKYMYGTAFRSPSVYEAHSTDGISQIGNPALGPERMVNHNVSVERSLAPGLSFVVEAFRSQLNDIINLQPNVVGTMGQFQNSGSERANGLEAGLNAQRKWLQGHLDYTLQRSVDPATKREAANSPRHLAKARFQMPVGNTMMAAMEWHYISDQRSYLGLKVPDSLAMNVTLTSRKPIFGFDMSASCYNVLDRRNFDPVSTDLVQSRLEQGGREFRVQISRTFWHR